MATPPTNSLHLLERGFVRCLQATLARLEEIAPAEIAAGGKAPPRPRRSSQDIRDVATTLAQLAALRKEIESQRRGELAGLTETELIARITALASAQGMDAGLIAAPAATLPPAQPPTNGATAHGESSEGSATH